MELTLWNVMGTPKGVCVVLGNTDYSR